MNSIIQNNKECFVCKTTKSLQLHHIFYGMKCRNLSEENGLKVWLCPFHHVGTKQGVHFNKQFDLYLKRVAEEIWIGKNHKTKDDFIKIFGKNYLD